MPIKRLPQDHHPAAGAARSAIPGEADEQQPTTGNPKVALELVQKQLDESNDRIRSLVAEHRLLRHKKYREQNILCLHKNPGERTDEQQHRLDTLVASAQNRSYVVAQHCANLGAVLPKNLRKAAYSTKADCEADRATRTIKSSLSKVLDDNLNNYASRSGSCLVSNSDGDTRQQARATCSSFSISASSRRRQHGQISSHSPSKRPANRTGGYRPDADNGAFWMEHDWKQVEKQVLSARSVVNRLHSAASDGKKVGEEPSKGPATTMSDDDPRRVRLERTVPDASCEFGGKQVKFDRSKKMLPDSVAAKNTAVELIRRQEEEVMLAMRMEQMNPGNINKNAKTPLTVVRDQLRNLNAVGSSKKRGPPPSQLASSTTLRQYQERTRRRASEAPIVIDEEAERTAGNRLALLSFDGENEGGLKKHGYFSTVPSAAALHDQPATSTQILSDASKPGPPRRYVRSGAYLIADRRRNQWKDADQYFIDSSPLRAIPKHKLVAELGFGLLTKDEVVGSSRRSDVTELTESTTE